MTSGRSHFLPRATTSLLSRTRIALGVVLRARVCEVAAITVVIGRVHLRLGSRRSSSLASPRFWPSSIGGKLAITSPHRVGS